MKARKTLVRTVAAATAAGALAWMAITGANGATGGGTVTDTTALKAIAEEGPGYAIEDFGYPNADKILAEQNITLKRGDGHILLADCASATDLLEVWSREKEKICFRVTGTSGYLTLEIPSVFAVKGNNYSAQVDMKVGEEEKTWDVNKNSWTAVGESADEQGREFMLMEIRTTK
ncbi:MULTISPECIES: hypothetical protein [unclassified Streptomyces]|uniref:hypothetical protein n=1 Tax=unclassified Streptomyces TaxID=2593676 RepID=UPI001BEC947E|nr:MULTISPECIES: hypothetical protein [unclassified Streptomyces]MBT2403104.1 hypothetical protein [Streptomyces sp. ISL-21]MBT2457593.1 hypothetical protein [Streptomyces sp. ISL-86]MBT2610219.1 hypothetical protein [Streptomyces sp. ISL-87]